MCGTCSVKGAVSIPIPTNLSAGLSDFAASVRGDKQGETQPDCRSTEPTRPSVIIQLLRLIPAPVSVYTSAPPVTATPARLAPASPL